MVGGRGIFLSKDCDWSVGEVYSYLTAENQDVAGIGHIKGGDVCLVRKGDPLPDRYSLHPTANAVMCSPLSIKETLTTSHLNREKLASEASERIASAAMGLSAASEAWQARERAKQQIKESANHAVRSRNLLGL